MIAALAWILLGLAFSCAPHPVGPSLAGGHLACSDDGVGSREEIWEREWKEKPGGSRILLVLPVVRVDDPVVQARIDAILSPESLIGSPRSQVEADGWVDSVGWEDLWRKGDLLALRVRIDGSGAYPSTQWVDVVLDLATGRRLDAEEFQRIDELVARLDAILQERIAQRVTEDPDLAPLLADEHFAPEELNQFTLGDDGITFRHTSQLPHVALAAAPDGDLLLPRAVLRGWLVEGSVLMGLAAD